MSICQRLQKKYEQLKKHQEILDSLLRKCPPGVLMTEKNGKHHKFFQLLSSEECSPEDFAMGRKHRRKLKRYIHSKDVSLIRRLAVKALFRSCRRDNERELKAIHSYLFWHREEAGAAERLLKSDTFRKLIKEGFAELWSMPGTNESGCDLSEFCTSFPVYSPRIPPDAIKEWQDAVYKQLEEFTEKKNIKSISGLYVRSKTEAVIAGELYRHDIPFRYECALSVNTAVYYPDFLILDPETGSLLPWEHFGMMDNPVYCTRALAKIRNYIEAGYIPGQNLILTFETSDHPLDFSLVTSIIEHYFF